jgi:arylsulfatase A-like enzyme
MDVRTLARTAELLRTRPDDKPQFILAFLTSTHFPYLYPTEFEKRQPVLNKEWHVLPFDPQRDLLAGINRYRNSCEYVDDIVGDFLDQIDLTKTIVVITGDHGESLHDDGTMAHGGRWSDSQMRVPCLILGAGVTPRVVDLPSNHMDILPTGAAHRRGTGNSASKYHRRRPARRQASTGVRGALIGVA